jgi:hypothetical protein
MLFFKKGVEEGAKDTRRGESKVLPTPSTVFYSI